MSIFLELQKHEEYEVALTKYKLAILSNPDSVALWNNIGTCFFAKGKYVAVSRYLTLLQSSVGSIFFYNLLKIVQLSARVCCNFIWKNAYML